MNVKISELAELAQIANEDYLAVLDTSDIAQGASGSTRKLPFSSLSTVSYFLRATGSNDHIAIQAAIDYIYNNGGGSLLLKPGSIAFDIAGKIQLRSYVRVYGGGYGTYLKANNSLSAPTNLFENYDTNNGNTHITLETLRLDGNYASRSGKVIADESGMSIMFKNCTNTIVKDLISYNGVNANIAFAQGTVDSIIERCITFTPWNHNILFVGTAAGVEVKRNTVARNICYSSGQGAGQGVNIELAKYATENTITDNVCRNALEGGIHMFYRSNRNIIKGNRCISNGQNGISIVDESDHNEIGMNIIESSTRAGVAHATAYLSYGGYYNNIHHNKIYNCGENGITGILTGDDINHNEIDTCGANGTGNQKYGIYAASPTGAKIHHNRVTNSGDRGIQVDNPQDCEVDYNEVENNPSHAIFIDGTTVIDTSVSNNRCKGNAGAGVIVLKNGTRMKINGNRCKSNTGSNSGIDVRGLKNSQVEGNISYGNTGYGIRIRKDSNNVESTDNIFSGNTCTGNTLGGISAADSSDYNIYTSNNCRGNTTANYSVVGANNQEANNITS